MGGALSVPCCPARRDEAVKELAPQITPHLARPPAVDHAECWLVAVFLRRYVSYCARRLRYAEMQGAADLHAEVVATMETLG
jgi:hypothetical protein